MLCAPEAAFTAGPGCLLLGRWLLRGQCGLRLKGTHLRYGEPRQGTGGQDVVARG